MGKKRFEFSFGRFHNKDIPPDVKPDEDLKEEKKEVVEKPAVSDNLIADVERIKAQLEALNESKANWSTRFSDMSERIGELRTLIAEAEKKISEVETKSTKASDLVESLEPEKILSEIQRGDAKFNALKSKMESFQAIYDRLIDEVKEVRTKIGMFRGVDALIKLSDEVRDELISIQKIKAISETHADKVEQMFLELRGTIKDFAKLSGAVDDLQTSMADTRRIYSEHDIKMKSFAEKRELGDFLVKWNTLSNEFVKYSQSTDKISSDVKKFLDIAAENKTETDALRKSNQSLQKYIEKLMSQSETRGFKRMKAIIDNNSKRLNEILGIVELLTDKVLTEHHTKKVKKIKKKVAEDKKFHKKRYESSFSKNQWVVHKQLKKVSKRRKRSKK